MSPQYCSVNSPSMLRAEYVLPLSFQELASFTKTQNFPDYFTLLSADFVPEDFELYNLDITRQNPSATCCSIALNVLLRTVLDYGLYLVIQKVDTLTVAEHESRPYKPKPEKAYANDGDHVRWLFLFRRHVLMFRSAENEN